MASLRAITRRDGSVAYRVYFRNQGRQSCYTFDSPQLAEAFRTAVDQLGAPAAIALHRLERAARTLPTVTVTQWVQGHIDNLTGAQPDTIHKYRQYLANDIAPALGDIPLAELSDRDVARWINTMTGSPKTIANKQRFLSSALAAAVKAGLIGANPAAGARIPRGEKREHVYLTPAEFAAVLAEVTEYWRPLIEFLVASGCRWGEATALKPTDVNRAEATVRVTRAWKYSPDTGYVLGAPKTRRSVRTINVPARILGKLDYGHRWLFVNKAGEPVRIHGFARRVWKPALQRAGIGKTPRIHDLRHTCASWMIQSGVSLPVVQQHLGHESIQTTIDVYSHLDRKSAVAGAAAISSLLAAAPNVNADD